MILRAISEAITDYTLISIIAAGSALDLVQKANVYLGVSRSLKPFTSNEKYTYEHVHSHTRQRDGQRQIMYNRATQ